MHLKKTVKKAKEKLDFYFYHNLKYYRHFIYLFIFTKKKKKKKKIKKKN